MLRQVFLIFTFAALLSCAHDKDQDYVLTLLHTNDIHGHLENFPALAANVEKIRAEKVNVLLLDAGDTLSDTLESMHDQGATIKRLMNEIGYDAMVPGNHDFDYGMSRLLNFASSGFPLIAENLKSKKTKKNLLPPYKVIQKGDLRIGVIGFTYPKTVFTTKESHVKDVTFTPVKKEVIEDLVQHLKKDDVDIIILLTHLGLTHDMEIAKTTSGIDLIVGGHSHNKMKNPLKIKSTFILQAGAHLQHLGVAEIAIKKGELQLKSSRLIALKAQKSPALENLQQRAGAGEVLSTTEESIPRADTMSGNFPEKRKSQSLADSMFADLLLKHFKADGVILPGVGYGLPLPNGKITRGDLWNLIPHASHLYRIRLKGSDIHQIVEQSLENVFTDSIDEKIGGIIQVAGIHITYHPERPRGQRVSSLKIRGQDYKPEKVYQIITVALLSEGGHSYESFENSQHKELLHKDYPRLMSKLIQKQKILVSPKDMRLIEVPIP